MGGEPASGPPVLLIAAVKPGYQKGGVSVDPHSRRSLSTARVSISGAPLQIRSSSAWMSSAVRVRFLRRRITNGSFPSSSWTDSPGRRWEAKAGFRTSSRFVIVFMLTNMSDACLFFKPCRLQLTVTLVAGSLRPLVAVRHDVVRGTGILDTDAGNALSVPPRACSFPP